MSRHYWDKTGRNTITHKKPHRKRSPTPACDPYKHKTCEDDNDCFDITEQTLDYYRGTHLKVAKAASKIEGRYYMKKTRLEEILLFSKEMGYTKLGVAFCIGLAQEAKILCRFLRMEYDVVSVCCKACALDKSVVNL